jgi:hypothetical protein
MKILILMRALKNPSECAFAYWQAAKNAKMVSRPKFKAVASKYDACTTESIRGCSHVKKLQHIK